MKREDAAKVARLRGDEISAEEAAVPAVEPADYRQLRQLRELDQLLDDDLLEELDRTIVDEVLALECINYNRIGNELELFPSTVWRRIRRLLRDAARLQLYAQTLLEGFEPQAWPLVMAMAKALASGGEEGTLDVDDYNRLARMLRGGSEARRLLYPPIPDPPRCLNCGRFIGRSATGRPRKWCPSPPDRCRSRYRRRSR